ncbi:MAG: hypothetical protein IPO21_01795 [Bacteroidales bacterium]|nr:hypothetical protein [Bacteroidales bacterium]
MKKKITLTITLILMFVFLKNVNSQSLDTTIVKKLKVGWNLVGFMGQTPEKTLEAFGKIMDKIEMIKTLDGFYDPEQKEYLNSLEIFYPLDGIFIKVKEDCILERTIKKSAILYIDQEIDPIFINSPAKIITLDDIVLWNKKLDAESQSLADVLTKGNNGSNRQIKGISNPSDNQDVTTKYM